MPPKNTVKNYLAGGYYHIYNRGVEKRDIFRDKQDYSVFLSYLKTYLTPKDEEGLRKQLTDPKLRWEEKIKFVRFLRLNNFSDEIKLLAYCLMPNHFHLLVKQNSPNGIDSFMNSLITRYVVFVNKKYKRVGPLFQSTYKGVLVETDEQLLHLSAYIHRNPLGVSSIPNLQDLQGDPLKNLAKQPSSLPEYLGERKSEWVDTREILSFFSTKNSNVSYQYFVLGYIDPSPVISQLTID